MLKKKVLERSAAAMGPQDLLDALDEIVYVSDPNTYELLYANRRCRSLLLFKKNEKTFHKE